MHGMAAMAETCVAITTHAAKSPATPAWVLAASLVAVILLTPSIASFRLPRQLISRARAGPSELLIPIRC